MRDWLSHRVRIEPEGDALVTAATGDAYTFANLDALVDDLAGRLAALGVDRGAHVGAVLEPRLEYACLVHAAMRLGVTLVPMGDRLTARELAGQIETADVSTVVCGDATEAAVAEAASRVTGDAEAVTGAGTGVANGGVDDADGADAAVSVVSVDEPERDAVTHLADLRPAAVTPAEWSLDDTQLVLFTSGTTGDPKAVRLTTGNLLASAIASVFRLGFDPADRWLVTLSLHHMGGIAPVLRMPLYGMTVVLRSGFDAGPAADDLDRYDATAVSLVPTMLRRMLDRRGTLADSLRVVLLGGAPATPELIERCRDYSVPVYPTYGMTETASQIATARPKEAYADPDSVGRPLFLTDVTVVGPDGTPRSPGEPGELVVDGPTVTPGYYGDPDATATAFGEFGFHTGDVGVVEANGALTILNRVDDRIVTGGENVDPGEVVDVLLAHPDVREAVVVGVPDAEWGERVSAVVVPEGDSVDRDDLLGFARDRLAGFKLPKVVAVTESLPRTVSGTVDREAVRERLSGDRGRGRPATTAEGDVNSNGVDGDDERDAATEPSETDAADTDSESTADGADAS
ncbi:o-succinylbenzoate--CoA ligase [Halobellus sp. Atlit-31R]|nr:o-succinylbenzoate--CoA ligase [Halobellus sp. Atlit-31R]